MTSPDYDITSEQETADIYARRSGCLLDHRDAPFRFQDQIAHLKNTIQDVEVDGIEHQPEAIAPSPPLPRIEVEESFVVHEGENGKFMISNLPRALDNIYSEINPLRNLRLPAEPFDLGYDLDRELLQYLEEVRLKCSANISHHWIPLAAVNIDKDEGLPFPPSASRWQMLASRELEREQVEIFPSATKFLHDLDDLPTEVVFHVTEPLRKCSISAPNPVAPPLSPTPESDLPFVPSQRAAFIDLTSEPNSPVPETIAQLQRDVDNERLELHAPTRLSSPLKAHAISHGAQNTYQSRNSQVEALIMSSSSSVSGTEGVGSGLGDMPREDLEGLGGTPEEAGGFFDEALEMILQSRMSSVAAILDKEHLDVSNSLLRLEVPALEFDIAQPKWTGLVETDNLVPFYEIPYDHSGQEDDFSLKWMPLPLKYRRIKLDESLPIDQASINYLQLDKSVVASKGIGTRRQGPRILRVNDEDEMDSLEEKRIDPPYQISFDMQEDPGLEVVAQPQKQLRVRDKPRPMNDFDFSAASQTLKMKGVEKSASVLPRLYDTGATSQLLDGYMSLRGPQKLKRGPRKTSKALQKSEATSAQSQMSNEEVSQPREDSISMQLTPALAPQTTLLPEKCRYIVALDFPRPLLRHLEMSWPSVELIDRDFSASNDTPLHPASGRRQKASSSLACEAELILSPSAAIIITTLLKAKQRPLPGSTTSSPLRTRISSVSKRYELLFILVSECNVAGECVGTLTASDLAAYADFVQFTLSLGAGITTYYVSGADKTPGKWVLSLMSQFTSHSLAFGRFLAPRETTWEVLLRRAGMNVYAAQVLASLLFEEFGDTGLIRFLMATTEEKVARYAQIMGGERVLRNICHTLNEEWP